MLTVILHVINEDPILGEMDEMPSAGDSILVVKNPRRRDGKDLPYLDPSVNVVIWPVSRVNYIEILVTGSEEEIISFVRE
jgi:hypothetical protein